MPLFRPMMHGDSLRRSILRTGAKNYIKSCLFQCPRREARAMQELYKSSEFVVDCIDLIGNNILCGLSRVEGNVWDGSLLYLSQEADLIAERRFAAGITSVINLKDGARAAVGSDDGNIRIISLSDLTDLHVMSGHDDIISRVTYAPHSNALASVGWDGKLNIWDVNHGCVLATSGSLAGVVYDVSFNAANETTIITVGHDGYVRCWDTRSLASGCVSIINLNQIPKSCIWSGSNSLIGYETGDIGCIDWRCNGNAYIQKIHDRGINRIKKVVDSENLYVTASDDCTSVIVRFDDDSATIVKSAITIKMHKDFVTDSIGIFVNGQKEQFRRGFTGVQAITCSMDKTILLHPVSYF